MSEERYSWRDVLMLSVVSVFLLGAGGYAYWTSLHEDQWQQFKANAEENGMIPMRFDGDIEPMRPELLAD